MSMFSVQITSSIIVNILVFICLGSFFFIDLLVYFHFGCLLPFIFYFSIFVLVYKYLLSECGLFSSFTLSSTVSNTHFNMR